MKFPARRSSLLACVLLTFACKGEDAEPSPSVPPPDDGAKPDAKPDAAPDPTTKPQGPVADGQTTQGKRTGGLAGIAAGIVSDAKELSNRPLALLPASARFVVAGELAPLRKMPIYEPIRDLLVKGMDPADSGSAMLGRLRTCGLDPDALVRFDIAIDDHQNATGLLTGPGFGRRSNYECLATELRKDGQDVKFTLTPEGDAEPGFDSEGDRAYFLADDALLLVDKELVTEMAAMRAGTGTAATSGAVAPYLAKVDQTATVWLAAVGDGASRFGNGAFGQATGMWLTVRCDESLAMSWSVESEDDAHAIDVESQFRDALREFGGMSTAFGLPSGLDSRAEIDRQSAVVTFALTLEATELAAMATTLRTFAG